MLSKMDWLRPYRCKPSFFTGLLHLALTAIVVGACVTHFFGEQGEIHLRADKASSLTTKHSTLTLFLWGFQVVRDGDKPVDFISELPGVIHPQTLTFGLEPGRGRGID